MGSALLANTKNHSSAYIRMLTAKCNYAPQDVLRYLSKDGDANVRAAVAKNILTGPEILNSLASDSDEYVRCNVAKNYNNEQKTFNLLARDSSSQVRYLVAKNPYTLAPALDILSRDSNVEVLGQVAKHDKCNEEILNRLVSRPEFFIKAAVALNRKITPSVLSKINSRTMSYEMAACLLKNSGIANSPEMRNSVLANTKSHSLLDVRILTAKCGFASQSVLGELAVNDNADIRAAVATNFNSGPDILQKIINKENGPNQSAYVLQEVIKSPSCGDGMLIDIASKLRGNNKYLIPMMTKKAWSEDTIKKINSYA